jgi:Domain of unknown function (DUF4157)
MQKRESARSAKSTHPTWTDPSQPREGVMPDAGGLTHRFDDLRIYPEGGSRQASNVLDAQAWVMTDEGVTARLNARSPFSSSLNASALAVGQELHFSDALDLTRPEHRAQIAHEFTHVKQQRSGEVVANHQLQGHPVNNDEALESQATMRGARASAATLESKPGSLSPSPFSSIAPSSGVLQFGGRTIKSQSPDGYKIRISYDDATQTILTVSSAGSYSGQNPHAKRGDHTTAMVSYLHMVENAVSKKTLQQALDNLTWVLNGVRGLPGMQQEKASAMAHAWLDLASVELKKKTADVIPTVMDYLIAARNHVPLSSFTHSSSTKGGGEGQWAGNLAYGEKQLEKQGKTDYELKDGDMEGIFKTLDLRKKPGTGSVEQVSAVVQQHLLQMRLSYPHMVGTADFKPMLEYAEDFWNEQDGTVFKGFDKIKDDVIETVSDAVKKEEPVQYVKKLPTEFTDDYTNMIQEL